jgi:hypothetical protein
MRRGLLMHYDFPYATPITTENEKEEVKKK